MADMACSSNVGTEGAAQAVLVHHDGGGVVFRFSVMCHFKSGGTEGTFVEMVKSYIFLPSVRKMHFCIGWLAGLQDHFMLLNLYH